MAQAVFLKRKDMRWLLKLLRDDCREKARGRRLHCWYRRVLRKRTEADYVAAWQRVGVLPDDALLKAFADCMELPNHYIHPLDRVELAFLNPYPDMREVEAIILLEEHIHVEVDIHALRTKYRYARNLFCRCEQRG